jgi:hypothetical protein
VRTTVEWPRSGPGHYHLDVTGRDGAAFTTVMLQARKLPPGGFEAMLADLHHYLPADVAISLKRAGGLAGITLSDLKPASLEEELARLRRAVEGTTVRPGLLALLAAVARRPHVVLQAYEVAVRRELLKRPRPASLVQALGRAAISEVQDRQRPTLRLPDERVTPSVDVYENRVIKACVDLVRRRLRALGQLAVLQPDLREPVLALRRQLDAAVRSAPLLQEVRALQGPPGRLTMVLLKRPEYRAGLELLLELHRSLQVTLDEERLLEPLTNAPALYQMWGTLQVIQALTDACTAAGFVLRRERLAVPYPGALLLKVLPDGQPLLSFEHPQDGRSVVLTSERTFRPNGAAWRSVSFPQRPDIVIEFHRPGVPGELWVLDPKYKLDSEDLPASVDHEVPVGQPKKVDIDKMHAYRDAIRDLQGRPGVSFAAILYPGPDRAFSDGLHALSALPSHGPSLRARLTALLQRGPLVGATSDRA